MKLDHIAYRVKDRIAAVWWMYSLGYKDEHCFKINFDDGTDDD